MLLVGDKAPDFSCVADDNVVLSLENFKGKKLVLYFYPKDDTPGCTKEACAFTENLSGFNQLDVAVVGVSKDSVEKHQKFKQKYRLQFPLLADTDEAVCNAYGVIVEKNMYGRKYMGIDRATFLIDEKGELQAIWRKVKVPGHIEAVLEALGDGGA